MVVEIAENPELVEAFLPVVDELFDKSAGCGGVVTTERVKIKKYKSTKVIRQKFSKTATAVPARSFWAKKRRKQSLSSFLPLIPILPSCPFMDASAKRKAPLPLRLGKISSAPSAPIRTLKNLLPVVFPHSGSRVENFQLNHRLCVRHKNCNLSPLVGVNRMALSRSWEITSPTAFPSARTYCLG